MKPRPFHWGYNKDKLFSYIDGRRNAFEYGEADFFEIDPLAPFLTD